MTNEPKTRPEIDPSIRSLLTARPIEFTIDDGIEAAREKTRAMRPRHKLLPEMRTEDRTVGFGDITSIPVRIYWPPNHQQVQLPIVVFYHGGGFAVGDLDTYDNVARAHAIGANAIVVSVDYRLAPEHPFPAAVEDSWAALRWVGNNAAELGGDPTRIAVAGDSAGGNLAAVIALRSRDEGGPRLAFQLLWYPWITGDLSAPSFTENADAPGLGPTTIQAFLTWGFSGLDLTDPKNLPVWFAPSNAETLAGLPPAFIGTAEHDPMRDDGAVYAKLLDAAGVDVQYSCEPTMVHGYVSMTPVSQAAAAATDRGISALRHVLHLGNPVSGAAGTSSVEGSQKSTPSA